MAAQPVAIVSLYALFDLLLAIFESDDMLRLLLDSHLKNMNSNRHPAATQPPTALAHTTTRQHRFRLFAISEPLNHAHKRTVHHESVYSRMQTHTLSAHFVREPSLEKTNGILAKFNDAQLLAAQYTAPIELF